VITTSVRTFNNNNNNNNNNTSHTYTHTHTHTHTHSTQYFHFDTYQKKNKRLQQQRSKNWNQASRINSQIYCSCWEYLLLLPLLYKYMRYKVRCTLSSMQQQAVLILKKLAHSTPVSWHNTAVFKLKTPILIVCVLLFCELFMDLHDHA
jgi:G3E family GTPase